MKCNDLSFLSLRLFLPVESVEPEQRWYRKLPNQGSDIFTYLTLFYMSVKKKVRNCMLHGPAVNTSRVTACSSALYYPWLPHKLVSSPSCLRHPISSLGSRSMVLKIGTVQPVCLDACMGPRWSKVPALGPGTYFWRSWFGKSLWTTSVSALHHLLQEFCWLLLLICSKSFLKKCFLHNLNKCI